MHQDTFNDTFHASHGIFTIHDSKAGAYLPPIFCQTAAVAIRSFRQAAIEPTHQFHMFAADFTLFQIGEFDQLTGEIAMFESKISLGNALEHQAESCATTERE